MRYIFQDPQNDLLQPPFLTSPLPLISAQFFLSLHPPPHWIDCPPPSPLPPLLCLFTPLCCHFLIRHCGGCYTWRKHVCADASFMLMGMPRTPYGHRQEHTHPNGREADFTFFFVIGEISLFFWLFFFLRMFWSPNTNT